MPLDRRGSARGLTSTTGIFICIGHACTSGSRSAILHGLTGTGEDLNGLVSPVLSLYSFRPYQSSLCFKLSFGRLGYVALACSDDLCSRLLGR